MVLFSIIVPLSKPNSFIEECIKYCLVQTEQDFEIIILPDEIFSLPTNLQDKRIKIIPTGKVGPAEKRDIAMKHTLGGILAFLDDDAYPRKDWLKNTKKYFENPSVGAVGGPAVTAPNDSVLQKVSGSFFSSFAGGGNYSYRYIPQKQREVDDYPTVNLLVRKNLMQEIGGFDTFYWPGEDTKLCLDIIKKGKKIIYAPEVLVYHHRRSILVPHLRQIWNYAIHRGQFVKRLPETSFRLSYFLPSLFILGLFLGPILSVLIPILNTLYLSAVIIYLIFIFASSIVESVMEKKLPLLFLLIPTIFISHLTYGVGFILGLIKKEL
jgi:GT2 family glycosyltransferase